VRRVVSLLWVSRGPGIHEPLRQLDERRIWPMTKRKSSKSDTPAPPQPSPPLTAPQIPYLVLARKYRPRTFDDLIGQDAMVRTLKNAFQLGRIAQAYMLTGVRGVGKTTTARILARALNYEKPGVTGPTIDIAEPGEHCQAILESRHMDVVEMDAASNTGIDDIREIIESVKYMPAYARYKVFIIDEVHMLSKAAFNGLLKTLEEPPPHVKFIFATTEIRKVPVTVLSRCQRFDLRRVGIDALKAHFARIAQLEGQTIEDDALTMIARLAEGSVRDGLSLLDQAFALGRGHVRVADVRAMAGLSDAGRIYDLLEAIFAGEVAEALARLQALHDDGSDPIQILTDLADAIHTATRIKTAGAQTVAAGRGPTELERASPWAERLSVPALARAWQMLLKGLEEAARAPRANAAAEMILIRMCFASDLPAPADLVKLLESGQTVEPATKPAEDSGNRDQLLLSAEMRPPAQHRATPVAGHESDAAEEAEDRQPASFADVVALALQHRDLKLKRALEEEVSLVRFRPGHIELRLLDKAPQSLAIDLSRKLQAWTGERWMVSLSDAEGERPLGEVRREAESRLLEEARKHPAVRAVLRHFPEAEITAVHTLSPGSEAPAKRKTDT
jgi:DNA polymerase-3 subunit gamma/tau